MSKRKAKTDAPAKPPAAKEQKVDADEAQKKEDLAFALQHWRQQAERYYASTPNHPSRARQQKAADHIMTEAIAEYMHKQHVCVDCAHALLAEAIDDDAVDIYHCDDKTPADGCQCWCQQEKRALKVAQAEAEALMKAADAEGADE